MKIILPLLAVAIVWVQSSYGETFSPASAAVFAVRHNRDLSAARFLIAEAEARLVQAGLWANPEFNGKSEFATTGQADWQVMGGIMQKFPLAGRLRKAKTVARVDVAMAIAELRDRERMLAGQVLGKGRTLLVQDRKLAVNEQNRVLLARILRETTTLAATGKAGVSDARVIELEQTTLDLAREGLLVERRAMVADLNGLLGRSPTAELSIAGDLPQVPSTKTLEAAAVAATSRRPDRQLAALQGDKSSAEEKLARAEKWEDLSFGFDMGRQREFGMEDTMAGLQISVPLPLWNRNQGRVAETQAAQQRAQASVAARDLAIDTEVKEAQARLTGLAAILDKTRGPAMELARKNTELLEQTYAGGTTPFLTIFESRRQRLMLEQNAVETEDRFAAAMTDWEMRTMHFPAPVLAAFKTGPCEGK